MQETDRKTCDYPGCSSAVYVTVLEHGNGQVEKLCLAHHKLTSKHFVWYRESSTYGHPTN